MTRSKLKERLKHPIALVGHGFVVGAILFWATAPADSVEAAQPTPTAIHATR